MKVEIENTPKTHVPPKEGEIYLFGGEPYLISALGRGSFNEKFLPMGFVCLGVSLVNGRGSMFTCDIVKELIPAKIIDVRDGKLIIGK